MTNNLVPFFPRGGPMPVRGGPAYPVGQQPQPLPVRGGPVYPGGGMPESPVAGPMPVRGGPMFPGGSPGFSTGAPVTGAGRMPLRPVGPAQPAMPARPAMPPNAPGNLVNMGMYSQLMRPTMRTY